MDDAWPTRKTVLSLFNHNTKAAIAQPHLKPSASSQTIQQIANEMGKSQQPPSMPGELECQQKLAGMPDFPEMDPPQPAENMYLDGSGDDSGNNRELNKLLNAGYRPLDKVDGEWSETAPTNSDNEKLLLE